MKTTKQIVDEIVAKLDRAGTFDAAKMPLLERFAVCAVEQEHILAALRRARPGSEEALRLSAVLASLTQEDLQLGLELGLPNYSENNADDAMPRLNLLWVAAGPSVANVLADLGELAGELSVI